ncbi:type II CAAX endopeptidase family protein [Streptosporangium sp. NPDC023963]|uniref:CPBP family intramembrane glutamic endopeptidase n=1 Tax=Streptosporangium sp. NPDC023963 TaxID=3155608 RepID=UPI00342870B9
MRATRPVWAVLITMAAMFVQILVGTLPVVLLMDRGDPLYRPLGVLGTTIASIALVYAIRRYLGHQSWSGVRLTWSRSAAWHVPVGLLVGAVPVIAGNALSVVLGVATWASWEQGVAPTLPYLALAIAIIVLGQAFPEELLWRGHLFDTLSDRLSPRMVLFVVSAGFGVMHIVSQSPADDLTEKLLYVVLATALGFACTAARVRSGAVWMAVGVHTGFHVGNLLTPTKDLRYDVQLILLTCALFLAGLAVLPRSGRSPHPADAELHSRL